MKFSDLLSAVGDEPLFEVGLLLAGAVDARDVRRQISRWRRAGRIIALRRGLYALAPPYARARPHPFVAANRLVEGSYVSCQSALAHHGLIPEHVPVVTSVAARRPGVRATALGRFEYRFLHARLLFGYRAEPLGAGPPALIATPEKALLDLIHLTPGGDRAEYLAELRLQDAERLDLAALAAMAERTGRPKLRRAARRLAERVRGEAGEYRRP